MRINNMNNVNQQNYIPAIADEVNESEIIVFAAEKPQAFSPANGMGILKSIHNIQQTIIEMGGIAKSRDTNSNNANFKYKFRGIEDIYNAISPLMVQHGIILVPYLESGRMSKHVSKKGDVTYKTVVVMRYTLYCIEDGSFIETSIAGEANDNGDKGTIKAQSLAQKAFFIQCFCIPTATNSDTDRYDNDHVPQHQNQYQQQQHSGNQYNRGNNGQGQQQNNVRYASLEFKNRLDEYMRKNNNKLCDVLKNRGLDMNTVTHDQLIQIKNEFVEYITAT